MKVRGDKWVKWDQEAVLVSHQKDQKEIQELEDQKALEDQRVSEVNQEKGTIFRRNFRHERIYCSSNVIYRSEQIKYPSTGISVYDEEFYVSYKEGLNTTLLL